MEKVNPVYGTTMAALYSGCDTVADNLEEKLAEMVLFKGQYDAAYVTVFRNAIGAARNLPDDQARYSDAEALLVRVKEKKGLIMGEWVKLGRYIEGAFPKDEWQLRRDEAGNKDFQKVGNSNWEALQTACTSCKSFLTAKQVTLEKAGLNMPAGFPVAFKTLSDAFDQLYKDFKKAEQTQEKTNEKITANNGIYSTALEVCKDGQANYQGNEGVTAKFTWVTIQELINPPGSSSLTITSLLAESDAPAVGAKVKLQKAGDTVFIELEIGADGTAKKENMDPGRYRYIVELAGRVTATGEKDVNAGTNARLEVKLSLV